MRRAAGAYFGGEDGARLWQVFGEDFRFFPECHEISPEDFEQRTAVMRLVLKESPGFPKNRPEW